MSLSWFNRLRRDERGSVGMMFALMSTVVFGIIGGAIDLGRAMSPRATLQAAADAAALDGARVAALGVGDPVIAATNLFHLNVSSSALGDGTAATTSLVQPAVSRSGKQITVTAETASATTFLQILGITSLPATAAAVAEAVTEENETSDPKGGDACVLLLDPGKHHALLVNGSSYVSAPGCEFHVRSNRESEAVMINSNVHFDVKKTCTAGGYRKIGGDQGVVGPIEGHCSTASDPYAGTLPVPPIATCDANGSGSTGSRNNVGDTANMTPGTFCGNQNFNGNIKTINLAPGTYVLKNSRWTFNGKLYGTGVTIYFADSNSYLQLNGQGSISITAPASGTYAGLLMYEPPNLSNLTQITVNGGSNSAIEGLIYLPSRDMTWNGNSGVESDKLTMVFNSLIINGNTTWRMTRHPNWSLEVPANGNGGENVTLKSIKLRSPNT